MESLVINSHKGQYEIKFEKIFQGLENGLPANSFLVIDLTVAELYKTQLAAVLKSETVLKIEANEGAKSLEKMPEYIEHLIKHKIRRGDTIIAVGGGVIQDIVAFIAAILFRGVNWAFYPTTLLAQADSCMGSKSSINIGRYKNQLGTFTPPRSISISTDVLKTLEPHDVRSGLGEIIKINIISGNDDFDVLENELTNEFTDQPVLLKSIKRALQIKKWFVENDEFDQEARLVLNYGHSFGHAIETATDYVIPHGIGVTIGMDMANFISKEWGFISLPEFERIHRMLAKNYSGFEKVRIPFSAFMDALTKDKKNVGNDLTLILNHGIGKIRRGHYKNDGNFKALCKQYLSEHLFI